MLEIYVYTPGFSMLCLCVLSKLNGLVYIYAIAFSVECDLYSAKCPDCASHTFHAECRNREVRAGHTLSFPSIRVRNCHDYFCNLEKEIECITVGTWYFHSPQISPNNVYSSMDIVFQSWHFLLQLRDYLLQLEVDSSQTDHSIGKCSYLGALQGPLAQSTPLLLSSLCSKSSQVACERG